MVSPTVALLTRRRFRPQSVAWPIINGTFAYLLLLGVMAWSLPGEAWAGDPFAKVSAEDVSRFITTGRADRNLKPFIERSGWTPDELQAGLQKSYQVNRVSVDRFLRSSTGERFLSFATSSYKPRSANTNAAQALRSAITKDASDGSISALGIMKALPVDFLVSDGLSICAQQVKVSDKQRTSALSYYLFLPACLHASQNVR